MQMFTCVVAGHASDEFSRLVEPLLADQLRLAVLWHRTAQADVHAMDPQCPIIGRTGDTMRVLEHANGRDFAALLERLPRLARHVLLESNRVPYFGGAIF